MTLARNPRRRRGRQPSPPKGEAKVVPLQAATPVDPRVLRPDSQRTILKDERPNGIVVTAYMDPPESAPPAEPRPSGASAPSFEEVMGRSRTGRPVDPEAPEPAWGRLNELEG